MSGMYLNRPASAGPPKAQRGSQRSILGLLTVLVLTSAAGCKSREKKSLSELDDVTASHVVAPRLVEGTPVLGEVALTGNRNVLGGMPEGDYALDSRNTVVLSRGQYVVAFNTKAKVPRWTAWQIVKSDIGDVERSNEFLSDDILNGFMQSKKRDLGVSPSDYTNTCFDRGHQSPAKDRSRTVRDSQATFFMSNMAPQTAFLNRGIWAKHEMHTRTLVEDKGKRVQVIAGPILRDGREGIGPDKDIAVPESFFKVVLVYADKEATQPESYEAIIMPNVTSNGKDPLAERDEACAQSKGSYAQGSMSNKWKDYSVTLAEVERQTQMVFPKVRSQE
jgi:DNA/RNA endonuclease G (NUC1)